MKENLDQLTIENFRIFSGSNTFKFTDLNIYTGANNSGKSTIIKAIKLFSEGLKKSDFPALNLISEESNLGSFENIINNKSDNRKTFKIGFKTKIDSIPNDFDIVYTFMDGSTLDEQYRETALFCNLEIINSEGVVLGGIGFLRSFDFPSGIKGDPGNIDFCFNVELLENYITHITDEDFSNLFERLNLIKREDGFWWGESFSETHYFLIHNDISNFYLADFERELSSDDYYNLGDFKLKEALWFRDQDVSLEEEIYDDILKQTKYRDFIDNVIHPILDAIKSGLDLFRNNNILHIVSDISHERLIKNNHHSEYLQKLYPIIDNDENIRFIKQSLAFFDIDGFIEIKSHLNAAFEVNLVTDLQRVLDENIKNRKPVIWSTGEETLIPYHGCVNDFKSNPRINIADLGKGTSNIVNLILKTAEILFSYKEEKLRKEELPESQGRKPGKVVKKTILFEEPEAFLHPKWQSRLVDFFIFCLKETDNNIKFIIETHSVYLIQRLQLKVAKEEFNPENATILYFNTNDKDEKFYQVTIRKDGILKESFGSGFYDETANLTAGILNSQNNN